MNLLQKRFYNLLNIKICLTEIISIATLKCFYSDFLMTERSLFYRFSISFTIGMGLMTYGVKFVTIVFEYKIILILKEM